MFQDRQGTNLNRRRLNIISQTPNELIVDIERADTVASGNEGTPITAEVLNTKIAEVCNTTLSNKQDTLQSGVNIKTVCGQEILGSGDITPAATPSAGRDTLGLTQVTSPDGDGTISLGSADKNNTALSFNMKGSGTVDFNDYRTPGEWYFYVSASSVTNEPPFISGSGNGYYLKVLMGYTALDCIQLCWRRESDEMWIRYSTSASAWSGWKKFATEDMIAGHANTYATSTAPGHVRMSISGTTLNIYTQ